MKILNSLLIAGFFSVSGQTFANEDGEANCEKKLNVTINAIELIESSTGEEGKLKDLTVADIKKLQAEKGSCAAMVEVNKRTM